MATWNHAQCERCWIDKQGTFDALGRLTEVRRPVRLREADCVSCCWCGLPTISGIYVRADPRTLNCSHPEGGSDA